MPDDKTPDTHLEHALRATRFIEEGGGMLLTSDHTRDDKNALCENLRRCFGGDV